MEVFEEEQIVMTAAASPIYATEMGKRSAPVISNQLKNV